MDLFNLPKSTEFGRVIPKNAFDEYTNTKQKKLIADSILRITWTHKLSQDTTNLNTKELKEIQIFFIELKLKTDLKRILEIINKAIPYHIIFVLRSEDEYLISTSAKHDHISKLNESVIDCTFRTSWIERSQFNVPLVLTESLDHTFIRFCNQITARAIEYSSYAEFVEQESRIREIESKIRTITSQVKKEKQFNKKVNLNMELSDLKSQLQSILKVS